MRSERPSGAAESENGCDAHQRPRVEEAPEEELARLAPRAGRAGVLSIRSDTTPGPSATTSATRRRKRNACDDRHEQPEHDDEQRERRDVKRAPVVGRDAVEHELVAGRNLVEPGERDPCVREQVHGVPRTRSGGGGARSRPTSTTTAISRHRADGRRDHPGVDAAAEHRRDLLRRARSGRSARSPRR